MNRNDDDAVFRALAHRDRRAMLDVVAEQPGLNVATLSARFPSSRITLLRHLKQLEAAQLVLSRKVGRERLLFFNAVPIQRIQERWSNALRNHLAGGMLALARRVEAAAADESQGRGAAQRPGHKKRA